MSKELTLEFISELGYKQQLSSWNRDDLSRMTIIVIPHPMFDTATSFEYVLGEQDVWQILFDMESKKTEIIQAFKGNRSFGILDLSKSSAESSDFKPIMEFYTVFRGTIKSQELFFDILTAVGAPFNS